MHFHFHFKATSRTARLIAATMVWLVGVIATSARPGDFAEGLQVIPRGPALRPDAGLELRFDEAVISDEQLGTGTAPSPLVIAPEIVGRFEWVSPRSGVFTPSNSLPLATAYRFRLKRGWTNAAGTVLRARLDYEWKTEPFSAAMEKAWWHSGTNDISVLPTLNVQFNAPVDAGALTAGLRFQDHAGRRVGARVAPIQPVKAEPPTALRWSVTPENPLPAGTNWQFIIAKGLPSADGKHRVAAEVREALGNVTPFEVLSITTHNTVDNGKRIRLRFSKQLGQRIAASNLSEFITVLPAPTNVVLDGWYDTVSLRGDFRLGTPYRVVVLPGLPAQEPIKLANQVVETVQFEPMPPRLYFPAFATHQWSAGARRFSLLQVNTPRVSVRVKELDPANLVHGLRGFRSYFRSGNIFSGDNYEPHQRIDFNLVPGRTVFSQQFDTGAVIDEAGAFDLSWDELAGGRKRGMFFVCAEAVVDRDRTPHAPGVESLVQLSDLGVAWKRATDENFLYVFSYATGKPVPNARVRFADDDGLPLQTATTDASGIARLPVAKPVQPDITEASGSTPPAPSVPARRPTRSGLTPVVVPVEEKKPDWLVVETKSDRHVLEWNRPGDDIPLYRFNLNQDWSERPRPNLRWVVFTDRGLYRPGETVHVKAIVREWADHRLAAPKLPPVTLSLRDPRGRECFSTNAAVSELGSFDVSFALPVATLGTYELKLQSSGLVHQQGILVQEFKTDAFEVKLRARRSYGASEPISIPLTANYYFGKKLEQASVAWSISAEETPFAPADFPGFHFDPSGDALMPGMETVTLASGGTNALDASGATQIQPVVSFNRAAPRPRLVQLLAEVTDVNQQTISQSASFTCHSSDFYLGLAQQQYVIAAGKELSLRAVAVDASGRPYAKPVEATLSVQKELWNTVRVHGAGTAMTFNNQRRYTRVSEQPFTIPANRGATNASEVKVKLTEPGQYVLLVRSQDEHSNLVVNATSVDVSQAGAEVAWEAHNDEQFQLEPDRAVYEPGATAVILVKTPVSGEALVTIEGDRVMRSFVTNLTGNAPSIEVPLTDRDLPNVYVSVLLIRGGKQSTHKIKMPEHRIGYCELKVQTPHTRLNVKVNASKTEFQPGQTVRLSGDVRDLAGQVAANSEVTLFAVDDAVLSMTGYEAPEPHRVFYAPLPLRVFTGLTLPRLFTEDPSRRPFSNKGYLVGGGGEPAFGLRKKFLPCPFWNGRLMTDAQGHFEASFTAPDSLTRYRILAMAHNAAQQFGLGESTFTIRKPVMIEPATPDFARIGDEVIARAVVYNESDEPRDVRVTLKLDEHAQAVARTNALRRDVKLPPHTTVAVEFPIAFRRVGAAKLIWKAMLVSGGKETFADGVENMLNVDYRTPALREVFNARITTPQTNLLAGANPQLLAGDGAVTVSVSNTRLSWLGEAMSQLLHYPYGCVEQTSSSLLPWIALHDLPMASIGRSKAEVDAAVRAGIQRLFTMQTSSGGLSYWPGGADPDRWGSAYGGLVLALARRAGWAVPETEFDTLLEYLSGRLRNTVRWDKGAALTENCLAMYALAISGRAEAGYHEQAFAKRALLTRENRAVLALAITASKGPSTMVAELLKDEPVQPAKHEDWFACAAREKALRLLALCEFQANDPRVEAATRELIDLQIGGHWTTTQGNAWSLLALAAWSANVERGGQAVHGNISWGTNRVTFELPAGLTSREIRLPLVKETATLPLILEFPGTNQLYAQTRVESHPRAAERGAVTHTHAIRREYQRVKEDGKLEPADHLRVGDRVRVTLRLDVPTEARYVAVEDPLPAFFEPVIDGMVTRRTRAPIGDTPSAWWCDFQEFRTDRALFFRDYLPKGKYEIHYLARVRAAGQASAPAARIEEMYHPEKYGLSAPAVIGARAAE